MLFRSSRSRHTTTLTITDDLQDINIAWQHCKAMVRQALQQDCSFYIGITENPQRRWDQHVERGMWTCMQVLVCAPGAWVTTQLERRLLDKFKHCVGCHNVGHGGECASRGRPRYLYLLLNNSGLLRRTGTRD